jgi:hypothetical protein
MPLFIRLEQTFERLYLDEVQANLAEHGVSGPFVGSNEGEDHVFVDCYLFLKLKGVAEFAAASEFLNKLPKAQESLSKFGKGKGDVNPLPPPQR